MPAYTTGSTVAGNANNSVSIPLDNTAGTYDFIAVGIIHDQAMSSTPSGMSFTLRDTASAGGYIWSFYTAPLTATFYFNQFFTFAANAHAVAQWVAFDTDGTGSLFDNLAVHSIDMHAVSGDTASEAFSSVDGWPFVWSWVTGSGSTANDVEYFTALRAQTDRSSEWLMLHGPAECAGFPTTWPFEWTLDTGWSFRRVSFADLAAPSNPRPEGCTIPDPPGGWTVGRVAWGTRGAWH